MYGRLRRSPLFSFERSHPVILPADSKISYMILLNIHHELIHPGHLKVMAESRKKYWIINCRKVAKKIGFECVTCRRWRGQALDQMMANLPVLRLAIECAPFHNTAVDYFGPITMKFGRRARTKGYGAVFSCMTTRCMHVELATDLSTDVFLLAFRRFISLYGQPHKMVSDNGTDFVGAAEELKDFLRRWKGNNEDSRKLGEFCAQYSIEWEFVTPRAPHHNGVSESLVKSVKTALGKVVSSNILTEEEYRTVFAEITACINSRPLWPATDGDIEEPIITCQDLLRPSGLSHDPPALNVAFSPRKRYHQVQQVVNSWWRSWMRHFAPNLQLRNKWYKERSSLEIGDIVLLIDPDTKRSHWSMGKVIEIYPSADDGKVRSVKVQTSNGEYKRPITKLTLLLARKEYDVKN